MVNIRDLIDDAKCYETVRAMRWPGKVTCPLCSSDSVIKDGKDVTEPQRRRGGHPDAGECQAGDDTAP